MNKFFTKEVKIAITVIVCVTLLVFGINFLKGVNGYGYKVTSNNIHNSIIYCSLIDERNKKIIQENSNGSVIKHSSNSKKEL